MNKIKIAVIEDEIPIQQMYCFRLEIAGYDVKAADNGITGLRLIEDFRPALILLDLKMPLMNGEDMLEKLRATKAGSNIKVLILTNISRDEAPRTLQFLHVDRYIVKAHYTPLQITNVVCEVLGTVKTR